MKQRRAKKFAALLEAAQREELSLDDLEAQSKALDPKLGDAVSHIKKSGPLSLVFILAALLMMKSCNFNVNVDLNVNQFYEQIMRVEAADAPSSAADHSEKEHGDNNPNAASGSPSPERSSIEHNKPRRKPGTQTGE